MELEELQKAWKELNERVSQNELVHQQQIIEMLSRQKESCLQRMLRLDKACTVLLAGACLFIITQFYYLQGNLPYWEAVIAPILIGLTVNLICLALLIKIKKETNLERQLKNVLQYKSVTNWGYIVSYLSIIPILCIFIYFYHTFWHILLISSLILICILIDYFIFHYASDKIKELARVNKELMKMKEEKD